jgi:uncharacterized protein
MNFKNAISWFEIPVQDLPRAKTFYEAIFGMTMIPLDMASVKMSMFPMEDFSGVGGALCYNKDFYKPSATDGPLIYLNGNPDVQRVLDKVPAAGGKVMVPKTQISPEHGFMAIIVDTEGNRVALHSVTG